MFIEKVRIQGFKSIRDLTLDGLGKVNVFHGLNDVGKSNILQAIRLAHQVLTGETAILPSNRQLNVKYLEFAENYGAHLFRLGGNKKIIIEVEISFQGSELQASRFIIDEPLLKLIIHLAFSDKGDKVEIKLNQYRLIGEQGSLDALDSSTRRDWQDDLERLQKSYLRHQGFRLIEATRRFHTEQQPIGGPIPDSDLVDIIDHNLKLGLYYAYLSPDVQQKRNLEQIRQLLAETPFNLGQLDIALERKTGTLDVGFVRDDGRLPIESLGSGTQQLLLVLGQVFLNANRIVAIEEPEMNLSPPHQQMLFVALKALLNDSNGLLDQLFISSHSPAFEFEETFFDVTFQNGETQVRRAPLAERARYFGQERWGPESGSRLNSQNQVTLFPDVVKDMHLERGDLIFFIKNEQRRWELWHEKEAASKLQEILQDEQ
jgi:hypothetical protein